MVVNQREELFECETENTHEPCDRTNISVVDKERGCDFGLRLQSPILCQRSLQVFILSWVIGWGSSLAKTFLSRLKMLLVNDTEDTKDKILVELQRKIEVRTFKCICLPYEKTIM